jgi:hypothetical protein
VIERIGRVCGADRDELLNLHRQWLLAITARNLSRTNGHQPVVTPPRQPSGHLSRQLTGAVTAGIAVIVLVLAARNVIIGAR